MVAAEFRHKEVVQVLLSNFAAINASDSVGLAVALVVGISLWYSSGKRASDYGLSFKIVEPKVLQYMQNKFVVW